MELVILVIVVLIIFGGGGYYGQSAGYYSAPYSGIPWLFGVLIILWLLLGR